jgi:hypothetical protein
MQDKTQTEEPSQLLEMESQSDAEKKPDGCWCLHEKGEYCLAHTNNSLILQVTQNDVLRIEYAHDGNGPIDRGDSGASSNPSGIIGEKS